MAASGRAAQQAALGSPEALTALLERALSGRLQARPARPSYSPLFERAQGPPGRADCFWLC